MVGLNNDGLHGLGGKKKKTRDGLHKPGKQQRTEIKKIPEMSLAGFKVLNKTKGRRNENGLRHGSQSGWENRGHLSPHGPMDYATQIW